jgi:hypothetical protein
MIGCMTDRCATGAPRYARRLSARAAPRGRVCTSHSRALILPFGVTARFRGRVWSIWRTSLRPNDEKRHGGRGGEEAGEGHTGRKIVALDEGDSQPTRATPVPVVLRPAANDEEVKFLRVTCHKSRRWRWRWR